MRRSDRAGIGRFTFHDREYLAAVRALDQVMALHTLRFHDEIVAADDLELTVGGHNPSTREIDMANRLIEALDEDFDPRSYQDIYRAAVLDLIRRKAKGEQIDLADNEEPAHGDDLEAALQASLGATG